MLPGVRNLIDHLATQDTVQLALLTGNLEVTAYLKLDAVGLAGYEKRKPGALSGGQRQRVAIARALVRARPVLILDEAFASLGPALRNAMLDLVADLHRSTGMTVIMVTHDPEDARRIAADLVFLDDGAVRAQGPVSELLGEGANGPLRTYLGHADD